MGGVEGVVAVGERQVVGAGQGVCRAGVCGETTNHS